MINISINVLRLLTAEETKRQHLFDSPRKMIQRITIWPDSVLLITTHETSTASFLIWYFSISSSLMKWTEMFTKRRNQTEHLNAAQTRKSVSIAFFFHFAIRHFLRDKAPSTLVRLASRSGKSDLLIDSVSRKCRACLSETSGQG